MMGDASSATTRMAMIVSITSPPVSDALSDAYASDSAAEGGGDEAERADASPSRSPEPAPSGTGMPARKARKGATVSLHRSSHLTASRVRLYMFV